ncbi:MAG: lamin tail domain-containing protein [Anaerolineae bacterium]|nr:lamin tail domain-containing protein [Anaerolineae bacterium]
MRPVMCTNSKRKVLFWFVLLVISLFGANQIFSKPRGDGASELIISEFLAVNGAGLADADGDFSDWIEIYNRSNQPVNMAGWSLTDDPEQLEKWTFPNISLGSHQYLVVFASGKDRQPDRAGAELHTNFKLDRTGEFLGLYNVLEDKLMDSVSPGYPEQFNDVSYGRLDDDLAFNYLAHPTPGAANDPTLAWVGTVAPVNFSVAHGFYDRPFSLALTADSPEAAIRYTTDGSIPGESHGRVYDEPLLINRTTFVRAAAFKPGSLPSLVNTQTYIFPDNVLAQPAKPPGFPDTWGTHAVDFINYKSGEPVQADYEMDPDIVNDSRYGPTLKEALKAIPTLSIVTPVEGFKIYANPREHGVNWEEPASVELIDPSGAGPGFQINAGIRIQGGAGRWEFMPKHSLRLFFRDKYGAPKLNYPLFADSPVEAFDTLILRAGSDRGYAGHPDTQDQRLTTYLEDEWLRRSQIAISGIGSHGVFVHLYLNGLYWGLYNLVEKPDESFMASYFGGQKEDWYVINHSGAISGSSDRFNELLKLAEAGGLANPARYAALKNYLDVTEFCDYLILEWYAGNTDWPQNNWYAAVQNPSGQVRFFIWDGELTWVEGAKLHVGQTNAVGLTNIVKPLFEALIQNPDFKMELADRFYKQLFNGGALTDANAQARWLNLAHHVEPAIAGESARWGDARTNPPITPDDWRQAREAVLKQMEGNGARLIAQARQLGYYPELDPPVFNQPGGLIESGFAVTLTPPTLPLQGGDTGQSPTIYYTTDGSDPRQPVTGAVAPTASAYTGPLILTGTTQVKARLWAGDWSALTEATFKVVEQKSRVAVTEIMYNPIEGNNYEFIELKNIGDGDLNLAGMFFDEGIEFTFPPGQPPLAPGGLLVLVHNATAFAERYPGVAVGGVYQGKLSNQGEKVTMRDASGQAVLSVSYDDENGWPFSPDGRGDSLVIVDAAGDLENPQNWRASSNPNGTPGLDE